MNNIFELLKEEGGDFFRGVQFDVVPHFNNDFNFQGSLCRLREHRLTSLATNKLCSKLHLWVKVLLSFTTVFLPYIWRFSCEL